MVAREPDEGHRPSTPLELFFDLAFVIAVSMAAARLHHALLEGETAHGAFGYVSVFFGIWWAWMNFTWFASAYDTDDVPYRLATLVQIAGVLVLAAGVPAAFDRGDYVGITAGYTTMRLAMVAQWLRAARGDARRRGTLLRYALGITVAQVCWVARLWAPEAAQLPLWVTLVIFEMVVPIWAERSGTTTWHPGHIAERYGLFTLIVLGESLLAVTTVLQTAAEAARSMSEGLPQVLSYAVASLVIVSAMWWLYFDRPAPALRSTQVAFFWGYGHLVIFASAAAAGAGLQVSIEARDGHHLGAVAAGLSTSVPVALYLLSTWVLHILPQEKGAHVAAIPVAALLVVAAAWTGWPVQATAAVLAALVGAQVVLGQRSAG
jgi:low temperature requirement protein LtrA